MDPVRRPYESRTGSARESPVFLYPTGPVRGLQECRMATVYARKRIDIICKNPARASYVAVKFLRALHSALRTIKRTGAKIVRGSRLDVTDAWGNTRATSYICVQFV